MDTHSHISRPQDSRCQWWQRIATRDDVLALDLASVDGARSLPGTYCRSGQDHELPVGSVVFDGEANHHRKQRGWTFTVGIVLPGGGGGIDLYWLAPTAERKAAIKAAPDGAAYMAGSGPHAAMVRMAQWILAGTTSAEWIQRWNALP
jgi:hypothetical protein